MAGNEDHLGKPDFLNAIIIHLAILIGINSLFSRSIAFLIFQISQLIYISTVWTNFFISGASGYILERMSTQPS